MNKKTISSNKEDINNILITNMKNRSLEYKHWVKEWREEDF